MPRPDFQPQSESGLTPATWESTPWSPDDRVVEEPMKLGPRDEPLMLAATDHVIDASLESDSIRRV